jgi:dGTPase
MSFITYLPYRFIAKPVAEQCYPSIQKENSMHEYGQHNEHCKRPIGLMEEQEYRSEFQRDYERIVHAKAYRRLVDKAQIFTSSKGDHYRTRLTHTLEVAQIARAIANGLNLNVELTEAIALAHDLGHTPFGHQGERTLDDILKMRIDIIKYTPDENKNFYGGFSITFKVFVLQTI